MKASFSVCAMKPGLVNSLSVNVVYSEYVTPRRQVELLHVLRQPRDVRRRASDDDAVLRYVPALVLGVTVEAQVHVNGVAVLRRSLRRLRRGGEARSGKGGGFGLPEGPARLYDLVAECELARSLAPVTAYPWKRRGTTRVSEKEGACAVAHQGK